MRGRFRTDGDQGSFDGFACFTTIFPCPRARNVSPAPFSEVKKKKKKRTKTMWVDCVAQLVKCFAPQT